MKKHSHSHQSENIDPVSRKTNEEIDEDEAGNLIVGGEYTAESVPSDRSFNEDLPKEENSLSDQELDKED